MQISISVRFLQLELTAWFLANYPSCLVCLQNEWQTPLHIAALEGDENMLKFLYLCKANPNILDKVRQREELYKRKDYIEQSVSI